MTKIEKYLVIVAGVLVLGAVAVYLGLLFSGPRMRTQPHIRTFEGSSLPVPNGTVNFPASRASEGHAFFRNNLSMTSETTARGRVYYTYYCVFCHGDRGAGDGPVGESYVPTPANLGSSATQSLSDENLLARMMTGVGHDPVLNRIILPEHWEYLLLYVRTLKTNK